jgi:hypothetical protein
MHLVWNNWKWRAHFLCQLQRDCNILKKFKLNKLNSNLCKMRMKKNELNHINLKINNFPSLFSKRSTVPTYSYCAIDNLANESRAKPNNNAPCWKRPDIISYCFFHCLFLLTTIWACGKGEGSIFIFQENLQLVSDLATCRKSPFTSLTLWLL